MWLFPGFSGLFIMGVKVKRKAAENVSEDSASEDAVDTSLSEPPSKKHKVLSAEDFIQELRGPNNTEGMCGHTIPVIPLLWRWFE